MKTYDISGFGGGYEQACQTMLTQGLKWLADNYEPNKVRYGGYENVFGLLTAQNDFSKELDKAICQGVDATGAMHHAVIQHIIHILKDGYEGWLSLGDVKDQYELDSPEREAAVQRLKERR